MLISYSEVQMREAFSWLTEESKLFLERGYLSEGESAIDRYKAIAETFQEYTGSKQLADKFYEYLGKGYYSLASPVIANYGKAYGLPVSCFGSYLEDSMESILDNVKENGMLMKGGGGTSGFFGALRPRGSKINTSGESSGSVHFMKLFDALADTVSQGSVRRGFFSAYLPIEHKDIEEFLNIGTDGNQIQGITTGVTVTDEWMQDMIAGDSDKRRIWAKVLESRSSIGYPYILFTDNANVGIYESLDMKIHASNMCSEIMLPSSKDETFVCVLSSMNVLYYDEWKDTDAVEVLTWFLDTVNEEFIVKTENNTALTRARNFAINHRALGVGLLGYHSYLQSKMIPFESRMASMINLQVAKTLKEKTMNASLDMGKLGVPSACAKAGAYRRNTVLTAIAPTKSSSFILGQVSSSIEPEMSNYYIKDLAKIKTVVKNPYLKDYLRKIGKDTQEIWESINTYDGSVQHLDFIPEDVKDVFKTFAEINPRTIIDQAAVRQEYIDQGQSLNLMIDPEASLKEINSLYIRAWELGVKSLYYQYSLNAAQVLARSKLKQTDCVACSA